MPRQLLYTPCHYFRLLFFAITSRTYLFIRYSMLMPMLLFSYVSLLLNAADAAAMALMLLLLLSRCLSPLRSPRAAVCCCYARATRVIWRIMARWRRCCLRAFDATYYILLPLRFFRYFFRATFAYAD